MSEETPTPEQSQSAETNPEQLSETQQQKVESYLDGLRLEQNLPVAVIGGFASAVAGAIIWAMITVATGYQIGYMAVGVGFLVGFAVRFSGKGLDNIYGIIGAAFALFGCLLGNFLSVVGFIAEAEGMDYFEVLTVLDFAFIPDLMIETFSPMDLLFYAIAVYEGYKFSFRQISEEELYHVVNS
jgi:hypothetical protein